jgi:hypothetical protein
MLSSLAKYINNYFLTIHSQVPAAGGWTQTLNPVMMRQVFYHCATAPGHVYQEYSV